MNKNKLIKNKMQITNKMKKLEIIKIKQQMKNSHQLLKKKIMIIKKKINEQIKKKTNTYTKNYYFYKNIIY